MNLQHNLTKYAELIVRVGLNVQPGDNILLRLDVNGLPLAREIAKKAYALGVHHIHPVFSDDVLTLARYQLAEDAAFGSLPGFMTDFTEAAYQNNFHVLSLVAPNPELLKDADPKRISKWQKVASRAGERVMKYVMENRVKWSIAALPSPAWAGAVFPGVPEEKAIDKLWAAIFAATRVDQDDPVAAWEAHDRQLRRHVQVLNGYAFEKLLFTAPGTDLTVYLPQGHRWMGGSSVCANGVRFMPNIPTEEVFTMPHAYKVDGTLAATMPLSTRGRIIDGMRFVFKDGAVVEFSATQGEEILKDMLDTDEGARRLGEVALVADDSPISNMGLLFRNTLFDENAACHFALGSAYAENHVRGKDMTPEEKREAGMNDSITHVDFMVGGPQLQVTGVQPDGTQVPIFVDGNWAV